MKNDFRGVTGHRYAAILGSFDQYTGTERVKMDFNVRTHH